MKERSSENITSKTIIKNMINLYDFVVLTANVKEEGVEEEEKPLLPAGVLFRKGCGS